MSESRPAVHGLPYRTDIDGLRGVAVLAVVLFHARLGCPGGFAGVDIFFVISGFLITSLILRDLNSSKFRLIEFWERRVRRIAPALTVWVAATLIAGWFLYLPDDFDRLGQAVVAQGLVLSNVYHGWRIDYFTPGTDAFPLLHTWSLAVEEQFYIVLPLILMVIHKWFPKWLKPLLIISCVLSFVLAVWLTKSMPRLSFWILPTRAWEMLLGALLAAYPTLWSSASRWVRELTSWGGLVAIFASIAFFDETVPFPGVATLIPTLGTFAFIGANAAATTTGARLLTWSPIVFVGKISYSLYLIHWPVIAYADYWYRDEMPWTVRLALMLCSFSVAVLSLYLIETPFRKGVFLSARRPLFATALCATALLMGAGFWVYQGHGIRSRFDSQTQAFLPPDRETVYKGTQLKISTVENGKLFDFGDSSSNQVCLAWGDSHAMAMMPVLDDLCRECGLRGEAAMYSNTPPLLGFVNRPRFGLGQDSPRFSAAVIKVAIERQVQMVVMVASWAQYASDPQFGECLKNTVDQLTDAGIFVVLVRDVPIHAGYIPRQLVLVRSSGGDVHTVGISLESHRQKNLTADKWLKQMAGPRVAVVDPTPYLTDELGLCRGELDGFAMYRDGGHLSAEGARRTKPMFGTAFHDHDRPAAQATLPGHDVR